MTKHTGLKKLCKIILVRTLSNFHELRKFWRNDGKDCKFIYVRCTYFARYLF